MLVVNYSVFTPLMVELTRQLWTLCISGDVDRVFIVSVSKVM